MEYEVVITYINDEREVFETDEKAAHRIFRDILNSDSTFILLFGVELKYIWPEGQKQLVKDYEYFRYINKDQIREINIMKYEDRK